MGRFGQGSFGGALSGVVVVSTPPTIALVSPPAGEPIGKTATVTLDVTDPSGAFRRIFIVAQFSATGVAEVVYDGAFFGYYLLGSTRTMITNGFRFVVQRHGGWPSAPNIIVHAINQAGAEA